MLWYGTKQYSTMCCFIVPEFALQFFHLHEMRGLQCKFWNFVITKLVLFWTTMNTIWLHSIYSLTKTIFNSFYSVLFYANFIVWIIREYMIQYIQQIIFTLSSLGICSHQISPLFKLSFDLYKIKSVKFQKKSY